ncbi:hypothetical protein [Stygiolobus caldivivus]|nr:hypothetical protein [Stygiolobus caldivivus]
MASKDVLMGLSMATSMVVQAISCGTLVVILFTNPRPVIYWELSPL